MGDVIILDATVDDVAFADEHLDDVSGFDFLREGIEPFDGFLEVCGAADLGEQDDGDIELFGKFGKLIDDGLDVAEVFGFVIAFPIGGLDEQIEVIDIDDVDVVFLRLRIIDELIDSHAHRIDDIEVEQRRPADVEMGDQLVIDDRLAVFIREEDDVIAEFEEFAGVIDGDGALPHIGFASENGQIAFLRFDDFHE